MTESASNAPRNGVVVPQNNGKQTYAELHQIADHFIGGNKVENAKDSKVKDFVIANNGHTVITNVSNHPTQGDGFQDLAAEMGLSHIAQIYEADLGATNRF